jgi:NADH-quinone oxidoreductase subunit N
MGVQLLHDLALFRPEIALCAAFLAALLAAAVSQKNPLPSAVAALLGLAAAAWIAARQHGVTASIFSGMSAVDPFSTYFKILVTGAAFLVVLFSLGSMELKAARRRLGEYYALIVSSALGMVLLAGATDLLFLYLAMELTGLGSYVLAGFMKEADDSSEAALKYVLVGALSSGCMVYGISILYGLTGSLNLDRIHAVLAQGTVPRLPLFLAAAMTLAGFGFKISAVPFHFWTPDVYQGAPTPVTAYLSVASKAAGFAALIRFVTVCFAGYPSASPGPDAWTLAAGIHWPELLAGVSVLTMTLGNLAALAQRNLKRMLAYSGIAHAGYMLMGVVVAGGAGIAAVLVYLAVYLFMNLGAFYVVMLVADKTGSEDIDEYRGLGPRAPLVGVAMAVFLLSLTGLPPTAGFIGKFTLFAAVIKAKWIGLAVAGAINSVISLYYYARIFRNLFLREPEGTRETLRFSTVQTALVLLLIIPTLVLGVAFAPVVRAALAAVSMWGAP